jgi:hypothetical protein
MSEAATPVTTTTDDHYDEEDEANENEEDEANENEEVEEEQVQEWDEGGSSHCGYSEGVHETLMAVGQSVHSVVGEPAEVVEQGMIKSVGNWFQEASYAVRDFVRGNKEVEDDASQTFTDMKEGAFSAFMGGEENQTPAPTPQQ